MGAAIIFGILGVVASGLTIGMTIRGNNETESRMKKSEARAKEEAQRAGTSKVLKALQQYAAGTTALRDLKSVAQDNKEKALKDKNMRADKPKGEFRYRISQQVIEDRRNGYSNGKTVK